MPEAIRHPGLTSQGEWILSAQLNMARQAMTHAADKLALVDLTGSQRRDISHGELAEMVDGLQKQLQSVLEANSELRKENERLRHIY